jgi:hypothetical protein
VVSRLACVLLIAACGSSKPRSVDDARRPPPATSADAVSTDAASTPAATRRATTGDVHVRVEWADVPTAARTSPGTTSCGTPRAAAVAPTTTWGIPDVLVIVEGAPPVTAHARVRFADCALNPRLVVGGSLALDTTADRPVAIRLAHRYQTTALRAALESTAPRTVQLPIAGHTATLPLAANEVLELTADAKASDPAWVVGGAGAVTDGSGTVLVEDVPIGTHAVRAWLPPRAGQPARFAEGTVTVGAGDLAELTLVLAPT